MATRTGFEPASPSLWSRWHDTKLHQRVKYVMMLLITAPTTETGRTIDDLINNSITDIVFTDFIFLVHVSSHVVKWWVPHHRAVQQFTGSQHHAVGSSEPKWRGLTESVYGLITVIPQMRVLCRVSRKTLLALMSMPSSCLLTQ